MKAFVMIINLFTTPHVNTIPAIKAPEVQPRQENMIEKKAVSYFEIYKYINTQV